MKKHELYSTVFQVSYPGQKVSYTDRKSELYGPTSELHRLMARIGAPQKPPVVYAEQMRAGGSAVRSSPAQVVARESEEARDREARCT